MLIKTGLNAGAIIGQDVSGTVWGFRAKDGVDVTLSAAEAKVLRKTITDADAATKAGTVKIGGKMTFIIRVEPDVRVILKRGSGGAVLEAANKCLVFGHYDENIQGNAAAAAVGKITDWLKEKGF